MNVNLGYGLWAYSQATLAETELNQSSSTEDYATVEQLINEWYSGYILKHRAHPQQIKQLIDADIIPLLGSKQLHTLKTAHSDEVDHRFRAMLISDSASKDLP